MDKIQPGDIVLCIDTNQYRKGVNPPLRKGAEYKVHDVKVCSCGTVSIDVGLNSQDPRGTKCMCGNMLLPTTTWWCLAKRFVKKTETKESAKNVKFNKKLIEEPLYSEN